jgi:hypothetical protein
MPGWSALDLPEACLHKQAAKKAMTADLRSNSRNDSLPPTEPPNPSGTWQSPRLFEGEVFCIESATSSLSTSAAAATSQAFTMAGPVPRSRILDLMKVRISPTTPPAHNAKKVVSNVVFSPARSNAIFSPPHTTQPKSAPATKSCVNVSEAQPSQPTIPARAQRWKI